MKIKKYAGNDMREAMAKVRAELGNDAVIVSTRRVDGRTEITAANDYDPEKINAVMQKHAKNGGRGKVAPAGPAARTGTAKSPSLVEIQDELSRLRKLFEGEISQLAWREMGNTQPNRFALLSRLETAGISRDIADKIVEKVLPCKDVELGWRRALQVLGQVIRVSTEDIIGHGGVIALLGSTGVGKTTTAAKIAARFALRHGRNQVALISTDSFRVGGQEQLVSFASVLGVPVQFATTAEEMQKTLASLSERKLVIIDTAGMSQRDIGLADQLKTLAVDETKIRPYLVLSATAQESVTRETIRAFSRIDLSAAIITKTDETGNIGPVISGLLRNRLPLAFLGNGQKVPEDMVSVKPQLIVRDIENVYEQERQLVARKKQQAQARAKMRAGAAAADTPRKPARVA